MNMQSRIDELKSYVRSNIKEELAREAGDFTPEYLWNVRGKLNVLRYYCRKNAEIPASIVKQVEFMLDMSASFWKMLSDNEDNLQDIKDITKVRLLDAESAGIAELEEIISGEESLRDIMVWGVSLLLLWQADTLWVNTAKRERITLVKTYLLELQDLLWRFIESQNATELSLEKASQMGRRVDKFLLLISSSELPPNVQVAILMQIYTALFKLQVEKLIESLDRVNYPS